MQCAHCATPVPDNAVYCHQCGSLVSDAEGQAAVTASMDDSAILHLTELLREDTQGEYEIIRQLGRGGMAVVFLAGLFLSSMNSILRTLLTPRLCP